MELYISNKLLDYYWVATYIWLSKQALMTEIVIDNKKYVLLPEEDFRNLQRKAALQIKPEKTLTIEEARSYSKKLIQKWAAEK